MKKYLLCSILVSALLLTGVSAYAVEETSIVTPSELTQLISSDIIQKLWSGEALSKEEKAQAGDRVTLRENRGTNYIVSVKQADAYVYKVGVFDFSARKWLIPCAYDAIFQIPENRYFLVKDSHYLQYDSEGELSVCYEAEADGTINPEPLPIKGRVSDVDAEGYVTLYQFVTVRSSNPDYADIEFGEYVKLALLDNQYQMVLDYIIEDPYGGSISFANGVAVIRHGSTEQRYGGHHQINLIDSKYGLINRRGEWVGRHDYTEMRRPDEKGNNRIFAQRDNAWYLLAEDGTETLLRNDIGSVYGYVYEIETLYSDWAREAIEQAKTQGLVPEKIDGCYTLDIFREEFCSLLMNLYRALGKESPSLEGAPAFTDCDLADVRAIAALGVVSGYDDGTFRPRNRITREEAAAMLSRFTALFRETDETAAEPYQDDAEIGGWAKPQVYAMRNAGIMSGTDSGFSPKGAYTIEQAISVANRLYDLLKGV